VIEPYLFSLLARPGVGRTLAETVLRRIFTTLLDSGEIRSRKRAAPLAALAGVVVALAALAVPLLVLLATLALGPARRPLWVEPLAACATAIAASRRFDDAACRWTVAATAPAMGGALSALVARGHVLAAWSVVCYAATFLLRSRTESDVRANGAGAAALGGNAAASPFHSSASVALPRAAPPRAALLPAAAPIVVGGRSLRRVAERRSREAALLADAAGTAAAIDVAAGRAVVQQWAERAPAPAAPAAVSPVKVTVMNDVPHTDLVSGLFTTRK